MKSIFYKFLLCTCIFAGFNSASAKIIERVIAIVNETIITQSDINSYKTKLTQGKAVDDLLVDPTQVKEIIKDDNKIIEIMIKERLLDSEVKKQGLQVTVERLDREIRKIAAQNNITKDQLKLALKADGIRFSDYQDFVKTRIERQDLIARTITSKIKISDEEISTYYLSKKGNTGSNIYEYEVAHILLLIKNANEQEAFDKAKAVYLKLKSNPSSFDQLAAEYSEDPNFSEGGILGTFKAGELVNTLDEVIKKLDAGQHSKITKTKRGYHILKVVSKKLIPDPAMERERNRIRGILYQQAFKKQFQFWIDQKRQEAFVRINKS